MKDWKLIEDLVRSTIKAYEEGFSGINPDYEVKFLLTTTFHKVEKMGKNVDVAYLRLERKIKPTGASDEEAETLLIHNDAYEFKSIKERLNEETPWKYDLYSTMLRRLVAGGLEYAELMRRMHLMSEEEKKKTVEPLDQKPDIIITDKMPDPLTEEELKYKKWVDENNMHALKKQGR